MTEREQLKEQIRLILTCPVPPMQLFAQLTKPILILYKIMGMEPPKCECTGCEDCEEPATVRIRDHWYCGSCAWGAFLISPDGAEFLSKGAALTKEVFEELRAKNEVSPMAEAMLAFIENILSTVREAESEAKPEEE